MDAMEVTGEITTYPLMTGASFCSEAFAGSGCATSEAMAARRGEVQVNLGGQCT